MKNASKFVMLTISLLMLSGCSENGESRKIPETEYQTNSETILSESSISETTVSETNAAETASETEETTEALSADDKSDEQQHLELLITEAAKIENPALKRNETIQSPIFGDFDGDGINELVAVYGDQNEALFEDKCGGEVWFASGEKAEVLRHGLYNMPTWSAPEIITSDGHVFLKNEMVFATDSVSMYHEIINSRPVRCEIDGYATQGLRPDRESGDFTAVHSTYDISSDGMGHTWKKYWYYYSPESKNFCPYIGTPISEDELLKYEGAADLLEKARSEGKSIAKLYRRDNGIININLTYPLNETDMNGDPAYLNSFYTLKAEGGAVTDITPEYNDGYYLP
ncbi:MAG: hypothetical protein MSJ26_11505 [Oscillospiraceae bacterium]|nr:hypothetical protein [Oscillospiraceae bacterium]